MYVMLIPATDAVRITTQNFPDAAFRRALCEVLGKNAGDFVTSREVYAFTMLDVTGKGIRSLKGIEFFPSLAELFCGENEIQELDLRNNPALQVVSCENNHMTCLRLAEHADLQTLVCRENLLEELDVSSCSELLELLCDGNLLTELDLTENPQLVQLWCGHNGLQELNLEANLRIEDLQTEALDERCIL